MRDGRRLGRVLRPRHKLARLLFRFLPFLQPLCWNMLIILRK